MHFNEYWQNVKKKTRYSLNSIVENAVVGCQKSLRQNIMCGEATKIFLLTLMAFHAITSSALQALKVGVIAVK